jgi:glycerol kinase
LPASADQSADQSAVLSAVLSIDAGGQSVRAALFSTTGTRLSYSQHRCVHQVGGSSVEQEPRAILAAIRLCLQSLEWKQDVSAAAIVSQGSSTVCYRRSDGMLLSPVISWQDRRGAEYLSRLPLAAEEVHARSGLPLSCHYGATKLRWCLETVPQVDEARRENDLVAGPLMSFLLHQLCSERPLTVDSMNASRTQLWNLNDQQWDPVLAEAFEVPTNVLPTGRDSCSRFGTLLTTERQIPVVFASRDQQATIFAQGRPQLNTAYVNLGTGAFIQCLIPKPIGPRELLINRVLAGTETSAPLYTLEGTVHGAAGAIGWMEQHLGFSIVAELLQDALTLNPPDEKQVYFINGVMGMGSPYWPSEPETRFSDGLTDQEKLLAWLESIVFMLVENLNRMTPFVAVDRLLLSGGFSNLSGLVQRLADLSGLPCRVCADHEATLRGAAYLAAGMPDQWKTEVDVEHLPVPNPGLTGRFEQWREAMGRLP